MATHAHESARARRTVPASDLQRNYKAIAQTCAETKEPVYITRNGYPELVVIDAAAYEEEKSLKQLVYEREMRLYEAAMRGRDQLQRGGGVPLAQARALRDAANPDNHV